MTALRIYDHEIGDPFAALNAYRQRHREARQREKAASKPPRKPEPASATVAPPVEPANVYRIAGRQSAIKLSDEWQWQLTQRECVESILLAERIYKSEDAPITTVEIIKWACMDGKITREQFESHRKTNDLAYSRFKAFYLMNLYTKLSLPQMGRRAGGKDHTTVLHGIRRAKELIALGQWSPPSRFQILEAVANGRA